MIYSINNFFDKKECLYLLKTCDLKGIPFSYTSDSVWDCKRVYDDKLNKFVLNRFDEKNKNNSLNVWFDYSKFNVNDINISLTKYYENRRLDLHLDATSQFTTVIVLSENFEGGNFIITENKKEEPLEVELEIGSGISFDGSKIYHGVRPVRNGIRCALNIWMTDTGYKFRDVSKKTLL